MKKQTILVKDYDSKESLLFVDRGREESIYANTLFCAAINSKFKKKVFLLSNFKNKKLFEIYKKLGFKNFINTRLIKVRILILIKTLFLLVKCLSKLYYKKRGFFCFINNFKVDKILIGDLVYDSYINYNSNYLNPKIDFYFLRLLFSAIYKTLLIKKYILKYNVKIIVCGTEHYSYSSGLAIRISTYLKGIKNFIWNSPGIDSFIEIVQIKKENKIIGYNSLQDKIILKRLNNLKINKNLLDQFYNARKNNLEKLNFYTRNSHRVANTGNGSNFISKIKKSKKNNISKVILFASHRLSDAVHMLGISYAFKDYYDQFQKTLSYAYHNDSKNIWVFRAHPFSNLGDAKERKELNNLIKKYKKSNIFFCPVGVPIEELKKNIDFLITGRGTVALEFLCEQKPVLLAGMPRFYHAKLGINYYLKEDEYFSAISNIKKIKKPSLENKNLARKILFFYEKGLHTKYKLDYKLLKKDKFAHQIFETTILSKKNKSFNMEYLLDSNLISYSNKGVFFLMLKKLLKLN